MSGKPLIGPAGILILHTQECDRNLVLTEVRRTGRMRPCPWRKSLPCRDKGYLAGCTNNKMDRRKDPRRKPKAPTAPGADNTSRSKCKATSQSNRRPCCPQFFDQPNPTPATRRFVTSRCEFVPGLRAPGPFVTDSGKGLDAQKFAFVALNNW